MRRIRKLSFLLVAATSLAAAPLAPAAPENLELTLKEAETLFRQNNLDLLAARYGIKAAEAGRLQASLWQNPNVQLAQNIYNPNTGKWFDTTRTGNTEVQVTQLIQLAGKHGKQIKLADFDTKISEQQFFDLLRNLTFQLRTTFFRLYYQQQALEFFDRSAATIGRTIKVAQQSYEKRSILLSEVLRLKALLAQLQSDRLDVVSDIAGAQSDLRTLLFNRDESPVRIVAKLEPEKLRSIKLTVPLEEVYKVAKDHRPDVKALENIAQKEGVNLSLQRSMIIPDLTLGVQYSRAGSYILDYYAFTVGFNIPIFDLNQGNIRASEAQLNLKEAQFRKAALDLRNDIQASYEKALEADHAVEELDANFLADYDGLVDKMVKNYERRNVGIIAFADFYESYRTSRIQYQKMQLKRINAFEELNLNAGASVVGEGAESR